MPRLAPAAEASAEEPPSWLSRAELIEEFWPGGRTRVSAVYSLGSRRTGNHARSRIKPALIVNRAMNLRRFERTISRSSKCTSWLAAVGVKSSLNRIAHGFRPHT